MSGHWATWMGIGLAVAAVLDGDVELGLVNPQAEKRDAGNSPVIPDSSQDVGAIVGAALEAAKPATRDVWTYGATWCGYCQAMATDMQAKPLPGISFHYTHDALPDWLNAGESLPVTVLWDTYVPGVRLPAFSVGSMSRDELTAWVEANKPPVIPQAVSVGKLSIRSTVRDILQRVDASGSIQVGSATIILPPTMQPQVKLSRQALVVTFAGAKPSFKWGTGWLKVGAPINGFTLTETRLEVSVDKLPDVGLDIE